MVCDIQEEYADHLFEILTEHFSGQYQFHLFHDFGKMKAFLAGPGAEVLLIGEECVCEGLEETVCGTIFILTGKPGRKERGENTPGDRQGKGCYPVFRYQSADRILEDIRGGLGLTETGFTELGFTEPGQTVLRKEERTDRPRQLLRERPREPRIRGDPRLRGLIGIYSPVHRIGKTKFAVRIGEKAAEQVPALYLNLEGYSGRDYYFPEGPSRDLGDLLYCVKQELRDHGLRISTMAGQSRGLDYIMPMGNEPDLRAVKKEEWLGLVDLILEKCIYEAVILDLGDCVDGLYEILRRCDRIYTPYITDGVSMAKLEQYEQNLRTSGYGDVLERTVRRRMNRTDVRRKAGQGNETDRDVV